MYRARLLVVVDDLQWAGAGSASALVTLSGRLATHRIGWLLALRRGELADAALDAAGRLEAAGASGIRLGPLGETAVAQVARDMLGGEPDEALREVLSRAEGQPFLLTELLRGLRMEDLAVVRLVIQGATDREAAQRLYISAHTVNSHLRHVFAKLGIRSRVELAHRAGQRQAAELPFRHCHLPGRPGPAAKLILNSCHSSAEQRRDQDCYRPVPGRRCRRRCAAPGRDRLVVRSRTCKDVP